MTGDPWPRVERIFAAAAELPEDQRGAFLESACGGDPDLRREVGTLLDADREAAEDFLRPPGRPEGTVARIGPYRLIEPLASGPSSAVYLAVRADDQYRKRVAIKLLHRRLEDAEAHRRFLAERQIVAGLEHPNVARLLDGGTTGEGQPYFVLEHVDGEPIDRFCNRHRLTVAARIELFLPVCAAVHYAHQHLVVHRDLKPDNVLVTEDRTPKLLDFGIAKLLDPERFAQPAVATASGRSPMTPPFASPEQVAGGAITTATDVYSLGVLLYLLVAGRLPYALASGSRRELEGAIVEGEPEPPHEALRRSEPAAAAVLGRPERSIEELCRDRATGARELRRQLAGDLGAILLRALAKEPGRRYATVRELADDLRRLGAGDPVRARPPTPGYRLRKFVRRHARGVTAAAILLGAVVGLSLGLAAAMAERAAETARQRDRVTAERDYVRELAVTLEDLFNLADPDAGRGGEVTVRELLDRGAERAAEDLGARPEVQARIEDTLGNLYRKLGHYDRALPLLERSLATRRRELGDDHPEVATSLEHLGELHWHRGDWNAAEESFLRALAIREAALPADSPALADSLNDLGNVRWRQGRLAEAEDLYRRALEVRERALPPGHPDLAASLNNLALVAMTLGDYAAAEPLYRRSLEIKRAALPADHPDVAVGLHNLAVLYADQERYAEAEPYYRQALAIWEPALGADHPGLVRVLTGLGQALVETGRAAAAEPLLLRARAIAEAGPGPESPAAAFTIYYLAELDRHRGRAADAEAGYRRSLSMLEATIGAGHFYTADPLIGLARLLRAEGREAEAAGVYRRALEVLGRTLPPSHPHLGALAREAASLDWKV